MGFAGGGRTQTQRRQRGRPPTKTKNHPREAATTRHKGKKRGHSQKQKQNQNLRTAEDTEEGYPRQAGTFGRQQVTGDSVKAKATLARELTRRMAPPDDEKGT